MTACATEGVYVLTLFIASHHQLSRYISYYGNAPACYTINILETVISMPAYSHIRPPTHCVFCCRHVIFQMQTQVQMRGWSVLSRSKTPYQCRRCIIQGV